MSVTGLAWGQYMTRDPNKVANAQTHLYEMLNAGQIDPVVYKTLPFTEATEGLRLMQGRELYGKIVITC